MSPIETGGCEAVGHGGVGESSLSTVLTRKVGGTNAKMMVLRHQSTSLCGDTGALAMLAVNGTPAATGNITSAGSSIQIEAAPGDVVAAVVSAVPLFNGIKCVRLGELKFVLDECVLEERHSASGTRAGLVSMTALETRDWYAWNNLMPPKPDDFHVTGEVLVSNPGVKVFLVPKIPQGFNPAILLLDLVLVQLPGIWPQMLMWKPVRYDKEKATYDRVQIFYGGNLISDLPVDNIV